MQKNHRYKINETHLYSIFREWQHIFYTIFLLITKFVVKCAINIFENLFTNAKVMSATYLNRDFFYRKNKKEAKLLFSRKNVTILTILS